MRLDKFLKVSRIIKRRTIANQVCDSKKVIVNGNVAKASYEVEIGDVIEILIGEKHTKFKVTNLNEHTSKASALNNYTIIEQ